MTVRTRRRLQIGGGAAVMAIVVLFQCREPMLFWAGNQLIDIDEPVPSDALLVLAGGTPDRELAAAALFHRGLAPRIVLTRNIERAQWDLVREQGITVEGELALRRRILKGLHVPDDAVVVIPGVVTSTRDEADAVERWAPSAGIRSLLIVTSRPHTARAKRTFHAALHDQAITVRMIAAPADSFNAATWWRADRLRGLLEWQKTVYHRLFD